jgi:hypothetical protein
MRPVQHGRHGERAHADHPVRDVRRALPIGVLGDGEDFGVAIGERQSCYYFYCQ